MTRSIKLHAIKHAFNGPGIALMSSFITLGALLSDGGFTTMQAILFSLAAYALPGQLVVAEMAAGGASIIAAAIAVFLVNARLLPITVVIISVLLDADDRRARIADYARAHLIVFTSWVNFMDTYDRIPKRHRRIHFTYMAVTLWLANAVACLGGFIAGENLPQQWLAALLFLAPINLLCVMLRALKLRMDTAAFFLGCAALPVVHQFFPEWDIVIVGVGIGGACFLYFQKTGAVNEGAKKPKRDRKS